MQSSTCHRVKIRGAVALIALALLVVPLEAPHADHGEPTATTLRELVDQLGLRLGELAEDFGFEVGARPSFSDPRFNKLLRRARLTLDHASGHVERDQVCEGIFKLARSVSQLEHAAAHGASRNMSGWGFAEDLASEASFVAETFLEDAVLLSEAAGVDPGAVGLARDAEATGSSLRADGEWTAAMVEFVAGTCGLF